MGGPRGIRELAAMNEPVERSQSGPAILRASERRKMINALLAFLAIGVAVSCIDLAFCRLVSKGDCKFDRVDSAIALAVGWIGGVLVKSQP